MTANTPPGVTTMIAEGWPESAEVDPHVIREQYTTAPPNMRAALDVIRRASPARMSYEEVERELRWPRGRLRAVIGGWRSRHGTDYTRPYRICPPEKSASGQWEMWMDEIQAGALR